LFAISVLASLLGTGARGQEVYNDNVVVILDASGSMGETMGGTRVVKMDAAKTALKEVLRQVPESTRIGLLVFSSANLRNDWVYPLGPRDDAQLVRAIDLPRPGGQTPLGAYIKKGGDRLLQERADQLGYGTYRLLIVTDGEAQDQGLVDSYTPEVISRGITVDVIGVDMERAHTLATKAHSYRRADDPGSLKAAMAEVFAEVSSTGTDTADEEAFALLAPIPDETTAALIKALSTSGNDPIGERTSVAGRVPARGAPPGPAGRRRQSRPVATSTDGFGLKGVGFVAFVLVVFGSIIAKSILGRDRSGA
jgi:uncharacterized protein YegL